MHRIRFKRTEGCSHPGPEPNLLPALPLFMHVLDSDGSVATRNNARYASTDASKADLKARVLMQSDCSVVANVSYGKDGMQGSGDELLRTPEAFQNEPTGSTGTALAVGSALGAVVDDLLADLDPAGCVMVDDFCSDWASTFD
jgi:hypothetical protein